MAFRNVFRRRAPGWGTKGFTLIELALVIGAVVVVLGVLIAMSPGLSVSNIVRVEQDIQALLSAGQAYWLQQPSPTYTGITFTELQRRRLLPPNASENNPWGNPYTVTGDVTTLTIATNAPHAGRCKALAAHLTGRASSATCAQNTLTIVFYARSSPAAKALALNPHMALPAQPEASAPIELMLVIGAVAVLLVSALAHGISTFVNVEHDIQPFIRPRAEGGVFPMYLLKNSKGFTLIELMLVIGAVAVLLAVLITGVGVLNTAKLARAEQDIQTIISAGVAYQAQQPSPTYTGISFETLKTLALLPPAASANNPWGNAYGVSGNAMTLTISTDTADDTRCTTISQRLAPRVATATCAASALTVEF